MNSVFDYLCLRRPRLDYIAPPFCENDFSGSGGPVIELDPFGRIAAPTGLVLSGEGNLTLSWDDYPGALCFNIYQAVDPNNPDGEYVIIAECVEGNSFQLPPGSGVYKVSAITMNGESDLSNPIVVNGGGGGCTPDIDIVGLNPISTFRHALSNSGILIGTFMGGSRPAYHFNNVTKDIRTVINSSPITASQSGNTILASGPIFNPDHVNRVIVFSTAEQAQITGFVSNQEVTVNPSQTVASTTFEIRGNTLGGALGQGLVSNSAGILSGVEEPFGGGDFHTFWLDTVANTIRDLGADRSPFDINVDGDLLLDNLTNPASHRTEIYDASAQTFTDLGIIEPGSQTSPVAFNDNLVAAVNCDVALPLTHQTACRWAGGLLTSIHPVQAGDEASTAVAINSSGNITGFYRPANGSDPLQGFVNFGGASTDLGNFGDEVVPTDINDSNTVVGDAISGSELIPFFWTSGGGIQAIPLISGRQGGEAEAINSAGWIVGQMYGSGNDVAYVYKDGATTPLINFVPAGSGWLELTSAIVVNNNKQIAGFGIHNTEGFSAYLLTLC